MSAPRVIPMLLLNRDGLVKTVGFKEPRYIGDPINAVRIFNKKEVDELILLDIDATRDGREPRYGEIEQILSEAFMPVGYGGGVTSLAQMERLFKLGVEKVVLNSVLAESPGLLADASRTFGAQSVVASVDVKRGMFGRYHVYTHGGRRRIDGDPIDSLRRWGALGVGEIFITFIDRDGTGRGLDLDFISKASAAVDVPVVAVGGVGNVSHIAAGLNAGASAVGAGSMFVFHGVHRAVLISYIDRSELLQLTQGTP